MISHSFNSEAQAEADPEAVAQAEKEAETDMDWCLQKVEIDSFFTLIAFGKQITANAQPD